MNQNRPLLVQKSFGETMEEICLKLFSGYLRVYPRQKGVNQQNHAEKQSCCTTFEGR